MSEAIQEYIFAHNYELNVNPHSQELDPDKMTYEVIPQKRSN